MYFMSVNATFAVAARTRKVSRRSHTCPTTGKILILHKPLPRGHITRHFFSPISLALSVPHQGLPSCAGA